MLMKLAVGSNWISDQWRDSINQCVVTWNPIGCSIPRLTFGRPVTPANIGWSKWGQTCHCSYDVLVQHYLYEMPNGLSLCYETIHYRVWWQFTQQSSGVGLVPGQGWHEHKPKCCSECFATNWYPVLGGCWRNISSNGLANCHPAVIGNLVEFCTKECLLIL